MQQYCSVRCFNVPDKLVVIKNLFYSLNYFTDCVGETGNEIGRVRLSVRTSVSSLTFKPINIRL